MAMISPSYYIRLYVFMCVNVFSWLVSWSAQSAQQFILWYFYHNGTKSASDTKSLSETTGTS